MKSIILLIFFISSICLAQISQNTHVLKIYEDYSISDFLESTKLIYKKPDQIHPTIQVLRPDFKAAVIYEIIDSSLVIEWKNQAKYKTVKEWNEDYSNWYYHPEKIIKSLYKIIKQSEIIITIFAPIDEYASGEFDLLAWELNGDEIYPLYLFPMITNSNGWQQPNFEMIGDTLKISTKYQDVEDISYTSFNYLVNESGCHPIFSEYMSGADLSMANPENDLVINAIIRKYYDFEGQVSYKIKQKKIMHGDGSYYKMDLKNQNVNTYNIDFENEKIDSVGAVIFKNLNIEVLSIFEDFDLIKIRQDSKITFVKKAEVLIPEDILRRLRHYN